MNLHNFLLVARIYVSYTCLVLLVSCTNLLIIVFLNKCLFKHSCKTFYLKTRSSLYSVVDRHVFSMNFIYFHFRYTLIMSREQFPASQFHWLDTDEIIERTHSHRESNLFIWEYAVCLLSHCAMVIKVLLTCIFSIMYTLNLSSIYHSHCFKLSQTLQKVVLLLSFIILCILCILITVYSVTSTCQNTPTDHLYLPSIH